MADPISSLFGQRPFSFDSIFKMSDITPRVQHHLTNVFAMLAATVLAASAGVMAHLWTQAGGLLTTFAAIGCLMLLRARKDAPIEQRVGTLLAFGFFKGMSIGGLVEVVLAVDPSILVTATLATTLAFACFSGAALVAKRRSYLFIGGTLSTLVSVMAMASLVNLFVRSPFLFDAQLYVGLAVFCGYVVFDTQMIVERASLGDFDYTWHAAELFIDLVAIFVRVLIILLKNAQKKEEKKNTRRR